MGPLQGSVTLGLCVFVINCQQRALAGSQSHLRGDVPQTQREHHGTGLCSQEPLHRLHLGREQAPTGGAASPHTQLSSLEPTSCVDALVLALLGLSYTKKLGNSKVIQRAPQQCPQNQWCRPICPIDRLKSTHSRSACAMKRLRRPEPRVRPLSVSNEHIAAARHGDTHRATPARRASGDTHAQRTGVGVGAPPTAFVPIQSETKVGRGQAGT